MDNPDITTPDTDRLPLTRSLEADVRAEFAVTPISEGLSGSALVKVLGDLDVQGESLLAALSEAGYKNPDSDSEAVIRWVDATFNHWTSHFPLAPEMQALVEGMRPMAAAFALTDARFYVPGGHALHRLLDVIHSGFQGWHAGLGASATSMLEGAGDVVERACSDFPSEPRVDEMLALLREKMEGHHRQLEQLDDVLLEREWTTLGDDAARLSVAKALNKIVSQHELPGSVARFIKSDWFESGVQTVREQGFKGDAWRTFTDTTQLLAEAVQPVSRNDESGQRRLNTTMQQLPTTLSKLLVSLQPDADAVAGAVGLIEYALLRNLRGEDLGLLHAEPIKIEGLATDTSDSEEALEELGISRGNWFALDTPEGETRIRYVGSLVDNHYLLFMDFLGARTLRKTWPEFRALVSSGEARCLQAPDSFCLSMVQTIDLRRAERAKEDAELAAAAAEEQAEAARAQAAMAETLQGEAPAETYREDDERPSEISTPPAETQRNENSAPPSVEAPYESNTVVKLQIPMGTWMGFHDRDPPLMAKVAVRDLEKDSYIFTNRDGIKLRELTVPQLVALIDRDMVDILERKTNFRETVNQMRSDQERLGTGVS
ncbi:MAG: DUF1631 domain-containing protein [Luminiphilus sp.]|nr:DUF1631 domain-containing protein [Luminiphilus sp.]